MGVINGDTRSLDCRSNMSNLDANGLVGKVIFLAGKSIFLLGKVMGGIPDP